MEPSFVSSWYGNENRYHKWRAFKLLAKNYGRIAAVPAPAKALDIGCGPGNITNMLRNFPNIKSIVGIDISDSMIEQARRNNHDVHVEFATADAANEATFPHNIWGSCDIVISFNAFHWMSHEAALLNIKRAMKPCPTSILVMSFLPAEYHTNSMPMSLPSYERVCETEKWKSRELLKNTPSRQLREVTQLTKQDMANLLARCGFDIVEINLTEREFTYSTDVEYFGTLRLLVPTLDSLTLDEQREFLEDCIKMMGGRNESGLIQQNITALEITAKLML